MSDRIEKLENMYNEMLDLLVYEIKFFNSAEVQKLITTFDSEECYSQFELENCYNKAVRSVYNNCIENIELDQFPIGITEEKLKTYRNNAINDYITEMNIYLLNNSDMSITERMFMNTVNSIQMSVDSGIQCACSTANLKALNRTYSNNQVSDQFFIKYMNDLIENINESYLRIYFEDNCQVEFEFEFDLTCDFFWTIKGEQ